MSVYVASKARNRHLKKMGEHGGSLHDNNVEIKIKSCGFCKF